MEETPILIPLATETPAPTETLSPTNTPEYIVSYTVVAPGSDVGQEVVFRYEMNAGDVMISMLLFGLFMIAMFNTVMRYWEK
jgi:hypothetical protein